MTTPGRRHAAGWLSTGILTAVALAVTTLAAAAPSAPPWTSLGPHRVGFRVIETGDPSRTFFGLTDGSAVLRAKPPRPLQIHVWYPARPEPGAASMHHRDYWALAERLGGVAEVTAERRATVHGELVRMLRYVAQGEVSEADIAAYLDRERPAVPNAPPEPGRFPLVLSQAARYDAAISEHLASHGYVVASVDPVGAASVTLDASPASLEAMAGDFERLVGTMRADPQVDPTHTAAVLFGLGVAPALLVQMRSQHLDAFVSLDGWDGFGQGVAFLTSEPSFDPQVMRVPYLRLCGSHDALEATRTREVFDACRYAERFLVTYPGIGHGDFSDDPVGSPEAIAVRRLGIAGMARHVTAFLDAALKDDPVARAALQADAKAAGFPAGSFTVEHLTALPAPPSERELVATIRRPGGVAEARTRIAAAREVDREVKLVPEATLNALGYELLGSGRAPEAVAVFRINVELYPDSPNVHDSLGEALEGQQLYREATESYARAAAVARRSGDGNVTLFESSRDRAARLASLAADRPRK